MNFLSPQLSIHPIKEMGTNKGCLYFKFQGKFTKDTSIAGSQAWSDFMEDQPNVSFEFVWDCQEMAGFEVSARKEWYKTMQKYKDRIDKVYVVSQHLMIRSAAKVMLQFFGIEHDVNRSAQDLPVEIRI